MKLKKIASLALAGVMAISMLAGCANGTTGNKDEDKTETEVTVSTTALNALKAAAENADKDFDIITYKDLPELASNLSTELGKATPNTWKDSLETVLNNYLEDTTASVTVSDATTDGFTSKVTTDKANIAANKPQYFYAVYDLDSKITGMTSVAWEAMTVGADLVGMPTDNGSGTDIKYTVSTFEYTSKAADGTATNYLIVLVKGEAAE